MRIVRVAVVACVLGLLGLLVWDVTHGNGPGVAQKVDKGRKVAAPHLDLPRLDTSGRLSLASLRGKVVVVNFWESYCVPCKEEARRIADAARSFQDEGVVFVGVNAFDTKRAARAYLARYGVEYPNIRDGVGTTFGRWGVTGVPETFFIDRRGRVVPPHITGPASRADLEAGIRLAQKS
jgi:cytochrome c biogenesis protein CcmG, thiol:disulfide interchange protein DsbE